MKTLDVITIGRSSVDLYGAQIGGRLEDMGSFNKYIGGSPTNMACGTARLGLKSALITRVGDEHMGRFIREELVREGVDVRGVVTDPARLSAGDPWHPRSIAVPADFLPRELRRYGAVRG
jgi:5-dehydro-2-deoxygluconokinase